MPKGDGSGSRLRVLTEEQARAIHSDRRTYKEIAIEYGVTTMTVSNIKTGRTWKSLGLQPTQRGKQRKSFAKSKVEFTIKQAEYIEEKVQEERVPILPVPLVTSHQGWRRF
jgi:hypothetical protein